MRADKAVGGMFLQRTEKTLLLGGILLITAYVVAEFHAAHSSRLAVEKFNSQHAIALRYSEKWDDRVDFTLWNPKRIQAYEESRFTKTDLPIAVLLIPKIHLEVPVFDGTDDLTLNRGAGRILGTAKVGKPGNMAIAAHRDGFFRGLKDVVPGDSVNLATQEKTIHFVIDRTEIVQPDDLSVLADIGIPSITLVTCYPFYFVGNAPQRFIVHASAADFDGPSGPPNTLGGGQIQNEGEP